MPVEPLAVTGVSVLFPGSTDTAGFWRDILAGVDLITDVPPSHWSAADYYDPDPAAPDRTYCKRGAFLSPVPFDPMAHGMPPSTLEATDSSQMLGLLVAERVLEDAARGQFHHVDRERISVILGTTGTTELTGHMSGRIERPRWEAGLRSCGLDEETVARACERISAQFTPWQENTFPGMLGNVIAGRIANRLDLGGTSCVVDAACASSLAAVAVAINELTAGGSDLVIVGGVDTLSVPLMYMAFSKTHALSRSGDCRPFSDQADGTVLGEGLGMLALRRLADAERDGDRIYAVLRGLGTSSDGRAKSIYAPLAEGQARAIRRAYELSGFRADTVELVEAHGTGTAAGDVAEFGGLQTAFAGGRRDRPWCALGSVKSQVGHTKGAAGIAGLFKAVMALHHKVLPPTIKVEHPNPALGIESSPFYLNTQARPWVRDGSHPRRAGVSAFGFGGTNYHVALEEYTGNGPRAFRVRSTPGEVLLWSADSVADLLDTCRQALAELPSPCDANELQRLSRTAQEQFATERPVRLALVASDGSDLRRKLERAIQCLSERPQEEIDDPSGLYYGAGRQPGQVALLFPGQGSQYVGMGQDLALTFDAVRQSWDEAADLQLGPQPLHDVVFPRPAFSDAERAEQAARLTATEWAQPALGACSMAVLALLRQLGIEADCVAGHSFGELSALCAAGVFPVADMLQAARRRGELMGSATAAGGAMIAVAAEAAEVGKLLGPADAGPVLANDNSPRQCVLSGPADAVEALSRVLVRSGIACQRLAVSAAFHSPLVESAVGPFQDFLQQLPMRAPCLPVYSNGSGQPYPQEDLRPILARQLAQPVRFRQIIEDMARRGVRTFVEVGPGSVLTGLTSDCLAGRPHLAVALDRKGQNGVLSLWHALARLAVQGVPMRWEALWKDHAPVAPPRPPQDQRLVVPICGANIRPKSVVAPVSKPALSASPLPETRSMNDLPRRRSSEWLSAFRSIIRETAAAQKAYQETMAESCREFFESMERNIKEVARAIGTSESPEEEDLPLPRQSRRRRKKRRAIVPPLPPLPRVHEDPPKEVSFSPVDPPTPVASSPPPPQPAAPVKEDLQKLLLEVVAEKTGYPAEMLSLDMEIEAGLGIDSIKRVEILSALEKQVPSMPTLDPAQMFTLRTLGDVLEVLGEPKGQEEAMPSEPAMTESVAEEHERFAVVLEEVSPSNFTLAGLLDCQPLVVLAGPTADGLESETAQALVRRLRKRGVAAEMRAEAGADASGVVHLGGLRRIDGIDAALDVQREAFCAARSFAGGRGGIFVTVQDIGGDFGLGGACGERAWLGGLPGLVKTAALEWPGTACKAIDVECGRRSPDELAAVLEQELLFGGPEIEVALAADGSRRVVRCQPAPLPAGAMKPTLEKGSVIVVSGGARGVTAAALQGLAAARPRLALLGRTPLRAEPAWCHGIVDEAGLSAAVHRESPQAGRDVKPADVRRQVKHILAGREIEANLAALRAAGAEVRYLAVDVEDATALRAALDGVRRDWGPIRGVIHGAGVLADRRIKDKSNEQLEAVLAAKVGGLRNLLEATRDDPLELLVLFSSVAARFGNAGQCDYALANEVLNKVAAAEQRRRGPSCRVKSLNWGPWDGGMVTPALKAYFQSLGVPLLPLEAGARLFAAELTAPATGVEVVLGCGATPQPLVPDRGKELALDVLVDPQQYAFLTSHCIEGDVPVLPAVLVLEWLVRAARLALPDLAVACCRDLKVLSGVPLPDFHRGRHFRIHCRQVCREGAVHLEAELRGAGGARHYSAVIELARTPPQRDVERPAPLREGSAWPWSVEEAYESHLFHGPDFQVLRSLDLLSPRGGTATVWGTGDVDWGHGPWLTNPAALDGGMQLVLLWALHHKHRQSLPTHVGAFVPYQLPPPAGPLHCELRVRESSRHEVVADVLFHDREGRPVAELRQLAMTLLEMSKERVPV
jgi:malonyl CoA-acyl carrier protein transacylase